MPAFTVKRKLDGLLHPPQKAPHLPADGGIGMINNACLAFGGVPADWEFMVLTEEQFAALSTHEGSATIDAEGSITVQPGFPRDLAHRQLRAFQRGFILNKPISDIRKRRVTRLGVING